MEYKIKFKPQIYLIIYVYMIDSGTIKITGAGADEAAK